MNTEAHPPDMPSPDRPTTARLGRFWLRRGSPRPRRLCVVVAVLLLALLALPTRGLSAPREAANLGFMANEASDQATIAFRPTTNDLAVPSMHGRLRLIDLTSGRGVVGLTTCIGCDEDENYGVAFRPDGAQVAVAGWQGTTVLDVATGTAVLSLPVDPQTPAHAHLAIGTVAWSADGSRLATLGLAFLQNTGVVCVYDARSGHLIQRIATGRTPGQWPAVSLSISPDGVHVVTGGQGGQTQVWEVANGTQVWQGTSGSGWVEGVVYSPNGALIATANDRDRATLWDARTGRRVRTIRMSPPPPFKWLGLLAYGHLFDRATDVAFSPDGTRLAVGNSDATAGVWEVATGRRLYRLRGHRDRITSLAFTSDGTRLATASADGIIGLWDVAQQP